MNRFIRIAEKVVNKDISDKVRDYAKEILKRVKDAYGEHIGKTEIDFGIDVKIGDNMPEDKIGSFKHPSKDNPVGVFTMRPKAIESPDWKYVVLHEMIHAVIGKEADDHGKKFDILSKVLKLPAKYRN